MRDYQWSGTTHPNVTLRMTRPMFEALYAVCLNGIQSADAQDLEAIGLDANGCEQAKRVWELLHLARARRDRLDREAELAARINPAGHPVGRPRRLR